MNSEFNPVSVTFESELEARTGRADRQKDGQSPMDRRICPIKFSICNRKRRSAPKMTIKMTHNLHISTELRTYALMQLKNSTV